MWYDPGMQSRQANTIPYFEFSTMPADGASRHAVFTRRGGVSAAPFDSLNLSTSVADDPARVEENRLRAYGVLGRTVQSAVHAHLLHNADVCRVTSAQHGQVGGRYDGLVTDEPGCGLTMNFADCSPILVYDPRKRAIGLGHAGWKGAVKDLPGALVRAMQQEFGSDPAELWAGVGPSIGPCCYEVGEPLVSAVRAAYAQPEELFRNNGGERPHFDLPAANQLRLQQAGVEHIELAGLCTACHTELFYSHRAEGGRTGRFGVLFLLS